MKYTDEETITQIVRRGNIIRDRRNHGRLCALGGLSVGLAIALIVALVTGGGFRSGNKVAPGGEIAAVETTQAPKAESMTQELAQNPGGESGSEDGQLPGGTPIVGDDPGGDIPGDTPIVGPGGSALPPDIPQQAEKIWIDKPWEIEASAASVLKLETYDAKGERICSGSGFVVYDRRFLVTARHVVVNMDHIVATTDWGDTFEVRDVIAVDSEQDIAVCRIPEEVELPPLTANDNIPTRGDRVVAIGSQFGVVNLITDGMLSGYWVSGDVDRLLFTAPVASGSSGGPLFDDHGKVIGVVSGTYDGGQNLNFAVPITRVYTLIESEMEVKKE